MVKLAPPERDVVIGAVAMVNHAKILAHAGEPEAALDRIERLVATPSRLSPALLRMDPSWDPLRDHPRFRTIVG
jgi:serine/threonine-protein kinase